MFRPKAFPWLLCALLLTGCQPLDWWHDRPLHPNARVQVYSVEGKMRFEKEWRQSEKHGIWRVFNEAGVLTEESPYDHGKKQGLWKAYYPSGKPKSEGLYASDKEEGSWKAWAENGTQIFLGQFHNGQKHGHFRTWNPEGKLLEESEWLEGKLLSKPESAGGNGSL